MYNPSITFDDVLIQPKFSKINSRKEVDLTARVDGMPDLALPIISANMDTVTGVGMAQAMSKHGGIGCLHRFCTVEENVKMLKESVYGDTKYVRTPIVSIGLGNKELERAEALFYAGAYVFCIDVAHGAQMAVVEQVKSLNDKYGSNISIVVGNFATGESVAHFKEYCGDVVAAFKIGIGPGSACTTRIKTGVGVPQLSAIIDCAKEHAVIADGGMKTPGDVAKALAAGASYVMLGGMLSGTDESPGDIVENKYKKYRGSASKESYETQGKEANWRTAEGESFLVPYKGSVSTILQDIEGGLRSAFTYVGASNLKEYHSRASFITVSGNVITENRAHGKG